MLTADDEGKFFSKTLRIQWVRRTTEPKKYIKFLLIAVSL